jgi:hypothetical protein
MAKIMLIFLTNTANIPKLQSYLICECELKYRITVVYEVP